MITSRTTSHPLLDNLRDPFLLSLSVLHGESVESLSASQTPGQQHPQHPGVGQE